MAWVIVCETGAEVIFSFFVAKKPKYFALSFYMWSFLIAHVTDASMKPNFI